MERCLELAKLGAGHVAPNPMVGAVLVHDGRIIGEGYHGKYGGDHAEVECIHSVKEADRPMIEKSVMYVSLEPCVHYGKTPPCTDLIIREGIPRVVINTLDPFSEVNGKGVEKLRAAGIHVKTGVLETGTRELNRRFFTFHQLRRPYVILKWAETGDGKIASDSLTRLMISSETTNRLVHKWRSEEAAILVGTRTAMLDNPELTSRLWKGPSPIRLVVDMDLSLPPDLKLFNKAATTIVFNTKIHSEDKDWSLVTTPTGNQQPDIYYYQVTADVSLVHQMTHALYRLHIQSVLVEGGAKLLQSFIDGECWDEARVIVNKDLAIQQGLAAPVLNGVESGDNLKIEGDMVKFYYHNQAT